MYLCFLDGGVIGDYTKAANQTYGKDYSDYPVE